MRSLTRYTLILVLISGYSCSPPSSSANVASQQHRGGVQDSENSFPDFWLSFRAAIKKKDVAAISKMTRFPLEGGLETNEDFIGVNTQEGFQRHFSMLFPDDAVRTLLTKIPDLDVSHSDARNFPATWSISHATTTALAEGEWTESAIIYRFTRLDDGLIKLTCITIAG